MYNIVINSEKEITITNNNTIIWKGRITEYYDSPSIRTIKSESCNRYITCSILISYITGYAMFNAGGEWKLDVIVNVEDIAIFDNMDYTTITSEEHRSKILEEAIKNVIYAYDPLSAKKLDKLPQQPIYLDDIRAEYIVNYLEDEDDARGYGWLLFAYKKYGSIVVDLAYVM